MSLVLTSELQATNYKSYDELTEYLTGAPVDSSLELDIRDSYYEKLGPVLVKCFDEVRLVGNTVQYIRFRPSQSFIVLLLLNHIYNA